MKTLKNRFLALFAALLLPIAANAGLIQYTSNTFADGSYMLALADVSFTGAGTYAEGGGLNSFELAVFDNGGSVIISAGNLSSGYTNDGFANYLTLDGTGGVTSWFLFANVSYNPYIYTISLPFRDDAYFIASTNTIFSNIDNPGRWTQAQAAIPEPGTLALLGLSLAGLGLTRRRKRL
ncbi:MAG: PEP-CTERM sorting domain-containing protein [Gammaproteobacteria bacterium]